MFIILGIVLILLIVVRVTSDESLLPTSGVKRNVARVRPKTSDLRLKT